MRRQGSAILYPSVREAVRSPSTSVGWRHLLWLALLVSASVAFSLGLACATPLAAFGAVCGADFVAPGCVISDPLGMAGEPARRFHGAQLSLDGKYVCMGRSAGRCGRPCNIDQPVGRKASGRSSSSYRFCGGFLECFRSLRSGAVCSCRCISRWNGGFHWGDRRPDPCFQRRGFRRPSRAKPPRGICRAPR
jgi:hypothetical protein